MAIQISDTTVIDDSRNLTNIANLKTVNGQSILGTGNIPAGSSDSIQALTDDTTINWNISLGNVGTLTLAGNRTFAAPTGLSVGSSVLIITQDGGGNRTLTWNSVFKWPGGVPPVLSTAAGGKDVISFICDGTNLYGSYIRGVS